MTARLPLTPVVRLAPAKLNLTLAVVRRRPDGYHDLHSVMVPLGLADRLSLVPSASATDSMHVVGSGGAAAPDCGPADQNLVIRAMAAARRAVRGQGIDAPLPPLAARLEKRIPVAAGLAGGSSDAAAALDGALEAWAVRAALGPAELAAAAASIGSDVPFFLAGGWALAEDRGVRITPLPAPRGPALAALLVTPALAVSTAAVFAAFDEGAGAGRGAGLASSLHLAAELAAGLAPARLLERAGIMAVANDLAAATAAVVPAIVPFRRALTRLLGRPVGQSGSGPTLWVLYPSLAAAKEAAGLVRGALADGSVRPPGPAGPFVAAVEIAGEAALPAAPPPTSAPAAPGVSRRSPPMTRTAVSSPQAPAAIGPYSQAIEAGDLVFCSGQLGLEPATGVLADGGVAAQAERCLRNLGAVLAAAGLGFEDVVKTTIFLLNIADFATVNEVYGRFVVDPPPARSTFAVKALPKGGLVEIEAIARRPA